MSRKKRPPTGEGRCYRSSRGPGPLNSLPDPDRGEPAGALFVRADYATARFFLNDVSVECQEVSMFVTPAVVVAAKGQGKAGSDVSGPGPGRG